MILIDCIHILAERITMKDISLLTPEVDTHTHTVVSGHAWSTLAENVAAAAQRGLKGICLTEHGPAITCGAPDYTPHSQRMLPDVIDGVRVYKGIEANILDPSGRLDIPVKYLRMVEFGIASYHALGVNDVILGSERENTEAYIAVLNNPYIDVLGHPDDPKVPCDLEALAAEAGRLGKLIELNNNRIASGIYDSSRIKEFALICKRLGQRVCVCSDAHYHTMVGNISPMLELLASIDFPEELIVNLTIKRFEDYLAQRKNRIYELADRE